jgi:DNA-binding transcriptional LysR family regulator
MDTQLLAAFIAVAKENSFSLAAEKLGLTQSAVSKRIALLENQVTQPLFDRIGRSLELTEAGAALLPRAKNILQEVSDTQQFMEDLRGETKGTLRIATSHHIGLHRLPSVLKTFTTRHPEVHLQLNFIDSEQAVQSILHGEFDLAVITLSESLLNDDIPALQHYVLWQDPMCFVVNKNHPLNKSKVRLADLAQYPAILPDTNTYTTQLIQELFDKQGETLDISMTTNHLDAIKMMINVGLGWSVLPQTLMSTGLIQLPVSKLQLKRQLGCIHHRERTLSNAARAMLQLLRTSE